MKDNKNIFIGCSIFIFIVGILFIVSLMIKDNRENMSNISTQKLIFNKTIININEEYLWNKKEEKARIKLNELYFKNTDKEISIKVKDQDNKEQEVYIVENETKEEDIILNTEYIIDFSMPKETYYIQFEIMKDDISYTVRIDYRDFQKI